MMSLNPWPGMGAVVATSIAAMTPVFGVAALATPIEHGTGLSAAGFGLALSVFFAVSALGAPVARRVAGRVPVPLLLAFMNVAAGASLLLAATGALVVAMVIGGVGNALTQPVAGRYVSARVPQGRLSLATGLVSAALGAAPLLPGLLAALVAGPYGWRTALMVAAVFPVLSLGAAPLARAGVAAGGGESVARPRPASVRRVLVLWALAAGLATVGSNAVASYFVQIGTHSGLSTSVAGLMQAAASIVAIVVRLVAGGLADRAPHRNPAVVAVMMLSGVAGLTLISLGVPAAFMAGAVLAVAGGWGWTGLLLAAVIRLLPGEGARAGATVQIGLFGGAAVAPFAFGAASTAFGISATVLVAAGVVAAGAASLIAGARLQGPRTESPAPADSRGRTEPRSRSEAPAAGLADRGGVR